MKWTKSRNFDQSRKEGFETPHSRGYELDRAALTGTLIAFIAFVMIIAFVATRPDGQNFDNQVFSFTYPRSWQIGDTESVPECKGTLSCFVQVNDGVSQVLFARFNSFSSLPATEVERQTWRSVQMHIPGIQLISRDTLTVAGFSAARRFALFPASYDASGEQMYAESIYFNQDDVIYVISATSENTTVFDRDHQAIDSIIASLQWKPSVPAPLSSS